MQRLFTVTSAVFWTFFCSAAFPAPGTAQESPPQTDKPAPPTASPENAPASTVEQSNVQALPDAGAEDAFIPSAAFGMPVTFTLRGGVSLGAFEAGYTYYLAEAIKQNPNLFDMRLVTGASAGSINALLLLMALGGEPVSAPEKSILYRVWTDLNQKDLLDTENPNTPVGALSSGEELLRAADKIRAEWHRGLDESFEMILGMSTTRLDPFEVEIAEGFKLQRQTEKFVFSIKGRGFGRPPQITNYVHAKTGLVQAVLPFERILDGDNEETATRKADKNFDMIRDVLMASAAFPVGFPPRRLHYCLVPVDENTTGNECTAAKRDDLFIDGGVFDNNPLRIAHRIASMGLTREKDGHLSRKKESEADPYLYIYLDPGHTSYPSLPPKKENAVESFAPEGRHDERDIDVLKMLPGFLGSFVKSARAAELYALIEEFPEVRTHMKLTDTDYPLISDELGAFFGFFDREFLKYDVGVEWSAPWFDGIAPQNNHWVTLIAGIGRQWLSPF